MTDDEEEPRLEVLSDTAPPPTSAGMVWVPTAVGPYGELTDWMLVREEVADQWDARRFRHFR